MLGKTDAALSDFAKAEGDLLDDLLRGLSDGAPALAAGEVQKFLNAVSLRTAPPRSPTGTQKPAPGGKPEAPAPEPTPKDAPKSPFDRLRDHFRK